MLDFLLGCIFTFCLIHIIAYIRIRSIEKRIDKKINQTLENLRKHIINSRIEAVNGSYFLYNNDTHEFIAQGTSLDELEKAAKSKYPDKLFHVPQNELNALFGDK